MRLRTRFLRILFPAGLAAALLACAAAHAGVSYRLDRAQATPGATVQIQAVFFNDSDAIADWNAPAELVLQWRDASGQVVRSLGYLDGAEPRLSVPVNNFARISWRAVVPPGLRGLQAVGIEGEPVLMALEVSPNDGAGTIAGTPANVPVIDAGRPDGPPGTGLPLPPPALAAAGASPDGGPAPGQATPQMPATATSAFDRFRNSLSAYEPVYFDFGKRGGSNARFQLSLKYRLFTPEDPARPEFIDNLYLGYTQLALWDLAGDSRPFIDMTYNPSLFWRSDKVWESSGKRWSLGLSGGVEHASNGKSGEDSRSLNDGFLEPALNYRLDGGSTLSFSPRFKRYFALGGETSEYADYAGYVDWKLRWAQDHGLLLSALYRQGDAGRRTVQLEAAWPLSRTFLHMNGYLHLQYFNGYGETLLGYNQRNESQFRIGLALVP